MLGKVSFRSLWKRPDCRLLGGWSFHGPAVSLGLIHTIKKSHLESKMILENALGRQPVVECKGILEVRGQNVLFAHLQMCTVKKRLMQVGSVQMLAVGYCYYN